MIILKSYILVNEQSSMTIKRKLSERNLYVLEWLKVNDCKDGKSFEMEIYYPTVITRDVYNKILFGSDGRGFVPMYLVFDGNGRFFDVLIREAEEPQLATDADTTSASTSRSTDESDVVQKEC